MIGKMEYIDRRVTQVTMDERARHSMNSLESSEPVESGDIEAAWRAETASRLAQVKRGEAVLVSAEDVFDNLNKMFQ